MNESNKPNPNKEYYLNTWKRMLGEFLGWSESTVISWAQETGRMRFLDDRDDIFYHESPQYWVTDTLIPESLRERLSTVEFIDLQHRLQSAFNDENRFAFPEDTDWAPYRTKLERILGEYGEYPPSKPSSRQAMSGSPR